MRKLQDNPIELLLSSHLSIGSQDRTQDIRLVQQALHLLSHLASPQDEYYYLTFSKHY